MMKILCLVLLVGVLAIEIEAWGPRVRFPRVRLPRVRLPRVRLPRVRLPRVRLPRVRLPRVRFQRIRLPIVDKARNAFFGAYKRLCGDKKRKTCGFNLVIRARTVCSRYSPCFRRNLWLLGKRSIESNHKNEREYPYK